MIDFNGISIAIKRHGSGQHAIIFIHGNSLDSDTWLPQLENRELNSKYQLIAFDLPGHGQSGWYQNDATKGYRPKNGAGERLPQPLSLILLVDDARYHERPGSTEGTTASGSQRNGRPA